MTVAPQQGVQPGQVIRSPHEMGAIKSPPISVPPAAVITEIAPEGNAASSTTAPPADNRSPYDRFAADEPQKAKEFLDMVTEVTGKANSFISSLWQLN